MLDRYPLLVLVCALSGSQISTSAPDFRNVHKDACDYYWDYCKYTDYSQLKVGMVIAVPSHTHTYMGGIYCHVCLYIGNNQVMDNVGRIRTLDMAYWLDYYSTSYKLKRGWYDNVLLA